MKEGKWTVVGSVAGVVAALVALIALFVSGSHQPNGTGPTAAATPTQAATETVPSSASGSNIPPPGPAVAGGQLPYFADWSSSGSGWVGPGDWKILDGKLVNDGTGEYSKFSPIFAPLDLGSTRDYAVTAEIRAITTDASSFGIVVRADNGGGGYAAGVGAGWNQTSGINDLQGWWGTNDLSMRIAEGKAFSPGNMTHTYRVEARGGRIRLLVDGGVLATAEDSKYIQPGQVGLWSNRYKLEVTSFRVDAL